MCVQIRVTFSLFYHTLIKTTSPVISLMHLWMNLSHMLKALQTDTKCITHYDWLTLRIMHGVPMDAEFITSPLRRH